MFNQPAGRVGEERRLPTWEPGRNPRKLPGQRTEESAKAPGWAWSAFPAKKPYPGGQMRPGSRIGDCLQDRRCPRDVAKGGRARFSQIRAGSPASATNRAPAFKIRATGQRPPSLNQPRPPPAPLTLSNAAAQTAATSARPPSIPAVPVASPRKANRSPSVSLSLSLLCSARRKKGEPAPKTQPNFFFPRDGLAPPPPTRRRLSKPGLDFQADGREWQSRGGQAGLGNSPPPSARFVPTRPSH